MSRVDVTLGMKNAPFKKGVEAAKTQIRGLKKVASGGFSFGKVVGAAALLSTVKTMADELDRFHKLSLRLGVSAENLQRWGQVAKKSGADVEQLVKGLQRANLASAQAADGSKMMADAFEDLGIEAEGFSKLDMEEQFLRLSDAVKNARSEEEALVGVQTIMGGRAAELIPLLQQGRKELQDQFKDVAVASNETIAQVAQLNDELSDAGNRLFAWASNIFGWLLLKFKQSVSAITQIVIEVVDGFRNLGGVVKSVLTGDFDAAGRSMDRLKDQYENGLGRIGAAWDDVSQQTKKAAAAQLEAAAEVRIAAAEAELAKEREAEQDKKMMKLVDERKNKERELFNLKRKAQQEELDSMEKLIQANENLQNAEARVLVGKSRLEGFSEDRVEFAREQKAIAEAELAAEKERINIKKLSEEVAGTFREAEIADIEDGIQFLNDLIGAYENERENALSGLTTFQGGSDSLTSIGVGVAGAANSESSLAREQRDIALRANTLLTELRVAVEAQELRLEDDDF